MLQHIVIYPESGQLHLIVNQSLRLALEPIIQLSDFFHFLPIDIIIGLLVLLLRQSQLLLQGPDLLILLI